MQAVDESRVVYLEWREHSGQLVLGNRATDEEVVVAQVCRGNCCHWGEGRGSLGWGITGSEMHAGAHHGQGDDKSAWCTALCLT